MKPARFSGPALLARQPTAGFSCGRHELDRWLSDHARGASAAGSARTYVVCDCEQDGRVVGYFALAAGQIERASASARVGAGMPRHPIPVVLLARLGVDESVQNRGLGAFLLADAMRRAASAATAIGVRALIVHAKDESARQFYLRFGFTASPTDRLHLMLLMKDLRASLNEAT